jgi:ribosomal protein S1
MTEQFQFEENFADMFAAHTEAGGEIKEGTIVKGVVVDIIGDFAVVDVGLKAEGARVKGGLSGRHRRQGVPCPGARSTCARRATSTSSSARVRLQDHQVQQEARQHRALSPRAAGEGAREPQEETLKPQEGQIIDGVVKNITDYGAFVDLGGIDGLLHITDMSWGRITHPSEMFEVGARGRGQGPQVQPRQPSASPGLKQIRPTRGTDAEDKYPVGTIVRARSSASSTTAPSSSSKRASRASSTSPRCPGPSGQAPVEGRQRSATRSRPSSSASTRRTSASASA